VPFPVWYRLTEDGVVDYGQPLVPDESRLPVDPSADVPDGYTEAQRGQPGGFVGDPDVMDTWATSLGVAADRVRLCKRSRFVRAHVPHGSAAAGARHHPHVALLEGRADFEHGSIPWKHAAISGGVLDPDRKKMSKSKGNVVTPPALLQEYGSDGVRYWAARGGPGVDTTFDVGQMKIGRRLSITLLNASKLALTGGAVAGEVTHPLDRGMLTDLAALITEATEALDEYEYSRVLRIWA
jgi:valyl-tRNA synthetase